MVTKILKGDKPWLGATEVMMIEAFGPPTSVEEKVMKTKRTLTFRSADETDNDCPKCNGLGFISEFSHLDGVKCFQCNGTGTWKVKVKSNATLKVKLEDNVVIGWDDKR